ncbi:MAG: DegQ family serine endoprotease [Proteobacteria bacterium]|nr:DegQ family serine endoprotease [Pseudomonadota bacterium]MBI3499756.1 DegQ family serine endoprotease [Pseudomonadota bacterium]
MQREGGAEAAGRAWLPGMHRALAGAATGTILFGFAMAPGSALAATPDSFADLADQLLPAVVNIATTQTLKQAQGERGQQQQRRGPDIPQFPPGSPFEEFFKDFFDRNGQRPDQAPRRATSLGSGFIIDAAGLVVTNNHVIADADEITVRLFDDAEFKAEIVGRDTKTDLALLRIKPGSRKLSAVKFGDSAKSRIGDWVIAIGNPFGLGNSVTKGIISARSRDINAGQYDDFIQTDAAINKGNSGGPLFNLAGEVIGINTAIYSPSGGSVGIGFAIPSNLAKPYLDQLRDYGKPRRGWLGVRIQGVTDEIAESLGLTKARGALVASISDGGPADKAKVKAGDVILTFDGKDVTEMRRLPRIVAETAIDKDVPMQVWRDGKMVTLSVRVGELEENEQQASVPAQPKDSPQRGSGQARVDALGLALSPITQELRQKFDIDEHVTQGVVVTAVDENGPAAEKGVRPGDIVVEVGQEEVKTPADIQSRVQKARQANRKSILLLVDRQGEMRFIALRIDKG